jgi:hypothetical protein
VKSIHQTYEMRHCISCNNVITSRKPMRCKGNLIKMKSYYAMYGKVTEYDIIKRY